MRAPGQAVRDHSFWPFRETFLVNRDPAITDVPAETATIPAPNGMP
jgi:hypothetical protein